MSKGKTKFKIPKRVVDFALLGWFLVSFFFLFNSESSFGILPPPREDFSFFLPKDLLIEDSWYGLYFRGSLIGYSHFFNRVLEIKEGKGYLMKNETKLTLPLLSTYQKIDIVTQTQLSQDYSLRIFKLNLKANKYFLREELERLSSNKFLLRLVSPARKEKREIVLGKQIPASLLSPFSFNYLPLRKRIETPFIDPLLGKSLSLRIENKGRTTIKVEGKTTKAYRLALELEGSKAEVFVDERGRLLKAKFLGFEFLKEKPSSLFRKISFSSQTDLILSFSIPVVGILNKDKLTSLEIKIKGLPWDYEARSLNFYNQQVINKEGSDLILRIRRPKPKKILKIPLKEEVLKKAKIKEDYLRESSLKIKKLALSIVGEEKDILKIIKKLFSWIDRNIRKIPTFSLFDSEDVLELKQGDCTELSLLLVSFLRSLGIPSYVNIGLVYQDGRFFYHAWVSVFAGEWIDVDVALSQTIADATHIKLFRGIENQTKLLNFLGNIKIEILKAFYD